MTLLLRAFVRDVGSVDDGPDIEAAEMGEELGGHGVEVKAVGLRDHEGHWLTDGPRSGLPQQTSRGLLQLQFVVKLVSLLRTSNEVNGGKEVPRSCQLQLREDDHEVLSEASLQDHPVLGGWDEDVLDLNANVHALNGGDFVNLRQMADHLLHWTLELAPGSRMGASEGPELTSLLMVNLFGGQD